MKLRRLLPQHEFKDYRHCEHCARLNRKKKYQRQYQKEYAMVRKLKVMIK